MLILMEPSYLDEGRGVYGLAESFLSIHIAIATPPDTLFLFATNPRICSKKKRRCLAVN